MTESVKVEIDESLAKRFRKRAIEKYVKKQGEMKEALEGAKKEYSQPVKADWGSLVGILKTSKDPVRLQRHAWDESY